MLSLNEGLRASMIATCVRALPDEGCGLVLGVNDGERAVVHDVVASENVLHSAKVYEIEPKVLLRAYRRADDEGLEVLGVFHSHTHSEAYPSPTDVAQAPDPSWHYVLVSLRDVPSVVRSYRVVDGVVSEEEVVSH
ncbi:MAG: M67 family metallopeptidase [Acidimicrobiales bacterium]